VSHHLLIVEDEEGLREGLRTNFQFEGYRVSTAADGVDGLDSALSLKPDLMILDIMLPGMNGFEVCRRIRAAGLNFPVLIMTVRKDGADRVKALELGADDYLIKPFSLPDLSDRVRALLQRTQPTRLS
jgi:two-component system response regulator MprA